MLSWRRDCRFAWGLLAKLARRVVEKVLREERRVGSPTVRGRVWVERVKDVGCCDGIRRCFKYNVRRSNDCDKRNSIEGN